MTQLGMTGQCANCNWIAGHHPDCPTVTYFQVDGIYQPRHAAPSFPTEPVPAVRFEPHDEGTSYCTGLPEHENHDGGPVPTWPQPCDVCGTRLVDVGHAIDHGRVHLEPSIFDQPDAATTHAKQTAHALIHEFETFTNSPGHWTDAAAGAWIGQACATLAELAK
jgi:hypothetical protein